MDDEKIGTLMLYSMLIEMIREVRKRGSKGAEWRVRYEGERGREQEEPFRELLH